MTEMEVSLKFLNKSHESLYLPNFLFNELGFKENQTILVYFGLLNKKAAVLRPHSSNKKEIYMTTKLQEALHLPYSKQLMIKKIGNGLQLGPIIGILTTDLTGQKFANPLTRENHPFSLFFKKLLAPEPFYPAYYFVFTPDFVDWNKKLIKGYFYKPNSKQQSTWEMMYVPIPDVVYNRVPNRTIERKENVRLFKEEYLQMGGKIFNPDFFDKWDMYKILNQNERTKIYIPETYQSPTFSIFFQMLKKYPIVYLKPSNGSLGLGVYKILNNGTNYTVQYRNGNTNKNLSFKTIRSVFQYIFSRKNRIRYLVQQGIDLIQHQHNPVDFRIHLNKNQYNEWHVTAVGAKAAGKGSVTTHLRTGGRLIDPLQYFNDTYQGQSLTIQQKIHDTAIDIARVVEESLNHPLGELGLDVGIDKQHHIWLFEVNSKPGTSIFKHPRLKAARMETSKMLLEYSIYLADFYSMSAANEMEESDS